MSAPRHKIVHGDSREVLARVRDNTFSGMVTDPPYNLTPQKRGGSGERSLNLSSPAGRARITTGGGFMGKEWDATGISFDPTFWAECLRVLKPGAYALVMGGTRTWHRIAVALEDAGFEIRDTVMWMYGSGFPKSLDVSKALDKAAGAEREVVGPRVTGDGHVQNRQQGRGHIGTFKMSDERGIDMDTEPASDKAKLYDGYGTALKPAWEPCLLVRKPLDGTVAQNVLEYGTGGLNIDGTRISAADGKSVSIPQSDPAKRKGEIGFGLGFSKNTRDKMQEAQRLSVERTNRLGRWPANVILDPEAAAMLDVQSGESQSPQSRPRSPDGPAAATWSLGREGGTQVGHGDSGGASRFFYCAKPGRLERELGLLDIVPTVSPAVEAQGGELDRKGLKSPRAGAGRLQSVLRNNHPTVKPLALMRYLVRLISPPDGGIVLDPFCGSGVTVVAAKLEGVSAVGVDMEERYVQIARAALKVPLMRRGKALDEAHREERREHRGMKHRSMFDAEQ